MRDWQKPLNEDQITWLVEQFDIAKRRIELFWGPTVKPWTENRER
jgi:hypothetical protein